MADFNLEAMSLKELRQLQKDLAKAISTYEDRHKAEARAKLEAIRLPRRWATLLPN
jgi:DNA-binding protein H-NS